MFVLTHGNVTVHEWKHDKPPPNQNQNQTVTGTRTGNENECEVFEIDWGDLGSSSDNQEKSPATTGIDFGESEIDFGESEIDFGADIDLSSITIEDSGEVGGEMNKALDEVVIATTSKSQPSGMCSAYT